MRRSHPLLFAVLIMFTGTLYGQTSGITVFNLDSVMAHKPKPVCFLLTADWCIYCQLQKVQLKRSPEFLQDTTAYYVPFNIETKQSVTYEGKTYKYVPGGNNNGIHALALLLNGEGTVALPTWVVIDKNYKIVLRYNGMLNRKQLLALKPALIKAGS